jgi:serine/threonine-protein kinase
MKFRFLVPLIAGAFDFVIASRSLAAGGVVESMKDRENASSPDGRSGRIYEERAWLKERAGDFAGAIAEYSAAIRIEPKSGSARYSRGLLYSALGKFNEAIADLDVVIKETPKASVYLVRGDAHADAGHAKDALADYDSAIRDAPNSADGNIVEAKACARKGDYARAAARFDQARRRSPRDDYALNSFAWFKATCPDASVRNGPEAVQAALKACEVTKWKDGDTIDTLAAAYAESGDFSQGIKYQMQALATRPPTAPDSLSLMQKHLRAYQAHKPFREEPRLRKSRS